MKCMLPCSTLTAEAAALHIFSRKTSRLSFIWHERTILSGRAMIRSHSSIVVMSILLYTYKQRTYLHSQSAVTFGGCAHPECSQTTHCQSQTSLQPHLRFPSMMSINWSMVQSSRKSTYHSRSTGFPVILLVKCMYNLAL